MRLVNMNYHKIAIISLLSLLICGCGGSSNEDGTLTFKRIKMEKSVKLSDEKDSPECTVCLDMLYASDEDGEPGRRLNANIISDLFKFYGEVMPLACERFIKNFHEDYIVDLGPLYNADRKNPEHRAWYDYHYIVTTNVDQGSGPFINYTINLNCYEGSAIETNQHIIKNFDKNTGYELTADSIFVNGYKPRLTKMLLNALLQKNELKNIHELRALGYLNGMEMYVPENFTLGPDNITFIYNPSEIAPMEKGATELIFTYKELKPLLKSSFKYQ